MNFSKELFSMSFLIIITFQTLACSRFHEASKRPSKLTQIEFNDSGALINFLEAYNNVGQQLVKQTVAIHILGPDDSGVAFKASAYIVDKHSLITSAHTFQPFFTLKDGALAHRFKEGALVITDALDRAVFRADFDFKNLYDDSDPKISMSTASDLMSIANRNLANNPSLDVAVIKIKTGNLERALGYQIVPMPLDLTPASVGDVFYAFGYARPEGRLALHAISFVGNADVGFLQSSENNSVYARLIGFGSQMNLPGDSGGPLVVYRRQTNELSLIGIVTGLYRPNDGYPPRSLFTSFRNPVVKNMISEKSLLWLPERACN